MQGAGQQRSQAVPLTVSRDVAFSAAYRDNAEVARLWYVGGAELVTSEYAGKKHAET